MNIENFINYLILKGLSPNTIKYYTYDVKSFFNSYDKFNRNNILSYINNDKRDINAKSRNRILSSLRKYNDFLNDKVCRIKQQDYITIQKTYTSPNTLNKDKALKFIDTIKRKESYRNYAIVMVIANTGLRISEVLSLRLNNIKLDVNEALIKGKGNKQREIILNNKTVEIIHNYINNYRNKSKYANKSPYLFVSNKGIKLATCTIQRIFNNYSDTITPHMLRHLFASNALENKILDVRQLQQQLGHSKLETVLIYTHPSKDAMKFSMNSKDACIG